jgi:hypothetical protein
MISFFGGDPLLSSKKLAKVLAKNDPKLKINNISWDSKHRFERICLDPTWGLPA